MLTQRQAPASDMSSLSNLLKSTPFTAQRGADVAPMPGDAEAEWPAADRELAKVPIPAHTHTHTQTHIR